MKSVKRKDDRTAFCFRTVQQAKIVFNGTESVGHSAIPSTLIRPIGSPRIFRPENCYQTTIRRYSDYIVSSSL